MSIEDLVYHEIVALFEVERYLQRKDEDPYARKIAKNLAHQLIKATETHSKTSRTITRLQAECDRMKDALDRIHAWSHPPDLSTDNEKAKGS